MYYLVIVHEDGATMTLHFSTFDEVQEAFNKAFEQHSVVYAHYAEVFGKPINWFTREV